MQNYRVDIPDRLESDLKGTLEHDDLPGWGAATTMWSAASHVGVQPLGAWESESAGDAETHDAYNGRTSPVRDTLRRSA